MGKGEGRKKKRASLGYPARLSLLLIFSSAQEKLKFAGRKIWFCKNIVSSFYPRFTAEYICP
ncbi:MAG: hypothetical protein NC306_11945 [Butyrivibrio sp.]|nr:hypothetical protein [Butyrivibrio sp.]